MWLIVKDNQRVAGAGCAPTSLAYEASKELLLHPAILLSHHSELNLLTHLLLGAIFFRAVSVFQFLLECSAENSSPGE